VLCFLGLWQIFAKLLVFVVFMEGFYFSIPLLE